MIEPASQRFRRTREDHRSENAEDYVELVHTLIEEAGKARVVHIAQRLGVSQVTVSKTVRRLVKEGFLLAEPYKSVELTERGTAVAVAAKERHQVVVQFLISIGVPETVAETDAEGIEHHVSPVTLSAMRKVIGGS